MFFFSITDQNSFFVYPLDDSYIHLTLARNLVQFGVLGINPYEFAYLTSSPLWTGILFVANLLGYQSVFLPLIFNFIFGSAIIVILVSKFSHLTNSKYVITVMTVVILLSGSIVMLTISGMEHLVHSLLVILFFFRFIDIYNGTENSNKSVIILSCISALMVLARFESLFIVLAVAIFSLIDKKIKLVVFILIFTLIPILFLGLYSLMQGGFFLPNSIIMKGEFSGMDSAYELAKSILYHPFKKLFEVHALLTIIIVLAFGIKKLRKNAENKGLYKAISVFVFSLILHLLFAQVGWLYRYEAYLIIVGSVLTFMVIAELFKTRLPIKLRTAAIILIALSVPFLIRAYDANEAVKKASKNIYEQQWFMSEFFKLYYHSEEIAVNDIGLISYRSGVLVKDIWGLANKEILEFRIEQKVNGKFLNEYLKKSNVGVAAVYEPWFRYSSGFPADWIKAGTWEIQNNIICGDSKVSFFAKDSVNYKRLVKNLISFSSHIPADVKQNINKR